MPDEQNGHDYPALAELRAKLQDGLAQSRLNQTQLASRAGVSRTTVSQALSASAPAPSSATVAALAAALKLQAEELLELRRTATRDQTAAPADADWEGPGRPIGQWHPHELEVHPAGPGPAKPGPEPEVGALPKYVRRAHDGVLASAVRDVKAGRSQIVVLVGSSSTGKTRACWEAVQPLAREGWRLWHPFDPTRAEAALADLCRVGPRTVVWLNEAQHYLGNPTAGERIAAAVHRLLVDDERCPVLILGTLWPEYAAKYTALPQPREEDPHSRVRELLAGRTCTVPETFDADALAAAAALAEEGDRLLAGALTRTRDGGRVTQDLAGAPELLRRYEQASPAAGALLEVAMDARRLGVGLHLPVAFLTGSVADYLSQIDYDDLTDDWAEAAIAELAKPVHGKQAPLRRTTPRPSRRPLNATAPAEPVVLPTPQFRLSDYLEQHGRTTRRHLCPPASFWHAAHTQLTHPDDLRILTRAAEERHRLQWAYHLRHRASPDALHRLAEERREVGNDENADPLISRVADHANARALYQLAEQRERAGDVEGAETLLRQAADYGNIDALYDLMVMRFQARDPEGAETLLRQAADDGSIDALSYLSERRDRAGDSKGAEALVFRAADHGNTNPLHRLVVRREATGDLDSFKALVLRAADYGDTSTPYRLPEMREVLKRLWPYGLDPDGSPTRPWRPSVSLSSSGHPPPGST